MLWPSGGKIHIFPFVTGRLDLPFDFLTRRRITQPLEQRRITAVFRPWRQTGVKSGPASGVSVHVGGNFQSFFLRGFNSRKEIVDLAPVRLASGFNVINLRRNSRFA